MHLCTSLIVLVCRQDSSVGCVSVAYLGGKCLYRADRCREAFSHCQGMTLFGSKIKLTLMEIEGMYVLTT